MLEDELKHHMHDIEGRITLRIKCTDGQVRFARVDPAEQIQQLLHDQWGVSAAYFRFIHRGQFMVANQSWSEAGVKNGDMIYSIFNFRGDVGALVPAESMEFLRTATADDLRDLAAQLKIKSNEAPIEVPPRCMPEFLDVCACDLLTQWIESRFVNKKALEDFQETHTIEAVAQIIGVANVDKLMREFGTRVDEVRIRRLSTQMKAVGLHTDHAVKTLQVALNADFEGGELIYVFDDGQTWVPHRPPGTVTIHNNTVVHGVTPLRRGVRYGLFFLHFQDIDTK